MNLFEAFKKLLSPHNSYVGIDIGTSSIKLVEIEERRGKLRLASYGELSLGLYKEGGFSGQIVSFEDDCIKKAIADILHETHVTSRDAGISISAPSALIVNLTIPQTTEKIVDSIVMTEMRKYVPIPLTELSIDWWPLPLPSAITNGGKKDTVPVMVAALRKERMSRYQEIAKDLNFTSLFYEIEIFSSARAVFEHDLSSIAIVDFGASSIKVSLLQYGVIRKYSQIKKGSYYLTDQLSKVFELSWTEAEDFKKNFGILHSSREEKQTSFLETQTGLLLDELLSILQSYEKESDRKSTRLDSSHGGISRMPSSA